MATLIQRLGRSLRKRLYRAAGGGVREFRPGLYLASYGSDRDAAYARYRYEQEAANRRKLERSWISEDHAAFLADAIAERLGDVRFGLCHGTRRGLEQTWLRERLPGEPEIVGTEIAESADMFPHTVRWDFHDPNPDWEGRADFVYSNSWDHAFDPEKAFRVWAGQLRSDGLMLLDHSETHAPRTEKAGANFTDPFSAEGPALAGFLNEVCADFGEVTETLAAPRRADETDCTVIIFKRRAGDG